MACSGKLCLPKLDAEPPLAHATTKGVIFTDESPISSLRSFCESEDADMSAYDPWITDRLRWVVVEVKGNLASRIHMNSL